MRTDKSTNEVIHYEDCYYIIEEYQIPWGKWRQLTDKYYLKEYEFGQNSACGQCWQETGKHGMYDLDYAKAYCNALNDAIRSGIINPTTAGVAQFRIACVEVTFKKSIIAPSRY